MNRAIVALSILGLALAVKSAWAAKTEHVDRKLLDQFFAWVLKSGDDFSFDRGRGKLLGITPGAPEKTKGYGLEDVTDADGHVCETVLRSISNPKPFCFLFHEGHTETDELTAYYFKIWPDGTVDQKVMISHVKYKDGKVVRGSGRAEWTTLHAPGIYEKFQHEMDFWLKGMYRKPSQTAESSGATGSVAPGAGQ